MVEKKEKTYVSYPDRVKLWRAWESLIEQCNNAFDTEDYISKVRCFVLNIPDTKTGGALKTKIRKFIDTEMSEAGKKLFYDWMNNNILESKYDEEVTDVENRIRRYQAERIFEFIIQLLEDYGHCHWASDMNYQVETKMI